MVWLDWLLGLVLIALNVLCQFLDPFPLVFDIMHADLHYPTQPDLISDLDLILLTIVAPLFICACYYRSYYPWSLFSKNLILGALVQNLVVETLKIVTGRPRPDFFARCDYLNGICTASPMLLRNGRKSWPSGHASTATYGMSFFTFWFILQVSPAIGGFHGKWRQHLHIIAILPTFLAIFIGITRVRQFVHFASDVFSGSVIGLAFAVQYYFAYHPLVYIAPEKPLMNGEAPNKS